MLVSKLIKKLEVEKGFKCNTACATCVCDKALEGVVNQIEVYAELKDVMDAEKYAKEVHTLEKEADALRECCNRLNEAFLDMVNDKVNAYCTANDKRLNFDEMSNEVYIEVYNNIRQSFVDEYEGGDRYIR